MKGTEQYFPVVLFIMLYIVVLSIVSVDEILKQDQSDESYCMSSVILQYGSLCHSSWT